MYKYEKKLWADGKLFVAGVDEVGRGPLVGPVVAAAVVLDKSFDLPGLNDSKKLSEKKRNLYFDYIMENAIGVGIGVVSSKIIDNINILEATKVAMKKALDNLLCKIDFVLIDGNMKFDFNYPYLSIIKGDSKSISIAAASVIAKVTRDKMMYDLDLVYPYYGFCNHKGYPTKKHIEMIEKYGIIDEHRKSFKPVKNYILKIDKER